MPTTQTWGNTTTAWPQLWPQLFMADWGTRSPPTTGPWTSASKLEWTTRVTLLSRLWAVWLVTRRATRWEEVRSENVWEIKCVSASWPQLLLSSTSCSFPHRCSPTCLILWSSTGTTATTPEPWNTPLIWTPPRWGQENTSVLAPQSLSEPF